MRPDASRQVIALPETLLVAVMRPLPSRNVVVVPDVVTVAASRPEPSRIDADDYHSAAAVERMKDGTPLADEYRQNWAERIIGGMIAWRRRGESVVIACSCIRRRTRDRFRTYVNEARIVGGQVIIAWLDVSPEVLKARLLHREEERTHFSPASLLSSQLDSAEPPDRQNEPGIIRIPVREDPAEAVARRVWESVPALHPFVERT